MKGTSQRRSAPLHLVQMPDKFKLVKLSKISSRASSIPAICRESEVLETIGTITAMELMNEGIIWNLDFSYTFSAILRLICDEPVVTGGRNQSTQGKPPSNPKSLATFPLALARLRTQAVVTDRG